MSCIAALNHIHAELADFIAEHGRVALACSGGLESSLLLHLTREFGDTVVIYTGRTGAEYAHVRENVVRGAEGRPLRVVQTDVTAWIEQHGIPSLIVPIEHLEGYAAPDSLGAARKPLIAPWTACCQANRGSVVLDAIKADGLSAVIFGQRLDDTPGRRPQITWPGLAFLHPLWDLSRQDVRELCEHVGAPMPAHITDPEYPGGSLPDCCICPAALTPDRAVWLEKRYPEAHRIATHLQGLVDGAIDAARAGHTWARHSLISDQGRS